jgi:hypothetical protein
MLTSIAKRSATLLRGIADALYPKPATVDYSIRINEPFTVGETVDKLKVMQAQQAMRYAGRL